MSNETMTGRWVIGRYTGKQAKIIAANAEAGAGYFLLEQDRNEVLVAFIHAGEPLPHHLTEVTDYRKVTEYEKRRLARRGQ